MSSDPVVTAIELLVIPDCPHDSAAADLIRLAVAETGVIATYTRTVIAGPEQARVRQFAGSPTFLVDGHDPFAQAPAPIALACRLYRSPDGVFGLPDLRDLCWALTQAAAAAGR